MLACVDWDAIAILGMCATFVLVIWIGVTKV